MSEKEELIHNLISFGFKRKLSVVLNKNNKNILYNVNGSDNILEIWWCEKIFCMAIFEYSESCFFKFTLYYCLKIFDKNKLNNISYGSAEFLNDREYLLGENTNRDFGNFFNEVSSCCEFCSWKKENYISLRPKWFIGYNYINFLDYVLSFLDSDILRSIGIKDIFKYKKINYESEFKNLAIIEKF